MRKYLFVFAIAEALSAQTPTSSGRTVASFSWPQGPNQIQQTARIDRAEISAFVNGMRPLGVPPLIIGEFRFASLEIGVVCLTATVDASGRELFYSVAVVCPQSKTGTYSMTLLESAPPHLLGSEVVDIDGDGVFEVTTRQLAGGYQGTQTIPLYWFRIFNARGGVPVDSSDRYPEFYRNQLLPQLRFILNVLGPQSPPGSANVSVAVAEARFLKAKYDRKFGGEATAGLDDATEWALSGDSHLKMLAIEVFREMSSPTVIAELDKLQQSNDFVVSSAAKQALEEKTSKREQ